MIDSNGDIIEMTVKDYIPYVNLDQEKKTGNKKKVEKILEIISDECSTSEGENMLVIDGESGDELEDLSDNVSDPKGLSSTGKKKTKKKKKCSHHHHEAVVGSDVEDDERMHDHAEDDIDDYAEFDDDERGYSPSVGPDEDEVDHDIEIEEEHEGDRNEDDEDVIDVDEEDGSEPLEFPCKIEYEKINVTIEGLKEKDRLDGSAEKIPPPIDDHDDNDDGDEGGDGDGRPPSKKIPQKGIEGEPSLDDIEKE
eukprot:s2634_g7.t1